MEFYMYGRAYIMQTRSAFDRVDEQESRGNAAMQRVFPTSNDFTIVICFWLRKVKAVI